MEFIVARAIETEREPSDAENLLADLAEKLDDPDDDEAFAELPVGLLAAVICHELGLKPDWDLWADESWVHDARAARFDDPPAAAPAGVGPASAVAEHRPP